MASTDRPFFCTCVPIPKPTARDYIVCDTCGGQRYLRPVPATVAVTRG